MFGLPEKSFTVYFDSTSLQHHGRFNNRNIQLFTDSSGAPYHPDHMENGSPSIEDPIRDRGLSSFIDHKDWTIIPRPNIVCGDDVKIDIF